MSEEEGLNDNINNNNDDFDEDLSTPDESSELDFERDRAKKSAPRRIFIGKRLSQTRPYSSEYESINELLNSLDKSQYRASKRQSAKVNDLFGKRNGQIHRIFIGKRGDIKRIFIG